MPWSSARQRRNKAQGTPLSQALVANDPWCADFKGEFKLGNGCYCYPLTVSDQATRAGQKLGIKEVDEGIWLVSFMSYDLGYIDLEQRTLQTIDNPFGSRLSPMS